jgi:hypothetical protein
MDPELIELYRSLGYRGSLPPSEARAERALRFDASEALVRAGFTDLPPLGLEELEELERLLQSEPDETLARAREAFDTELTLGQLQQAIAQARAALSAPREFLEMREADARFRAAVSRLPGDFNFPGIDLAEIPIDPGNTQFESEGDLLGWVLFSGWAWIKGKLNLLNKAPFRWHDDPVHGATRFTYPLRHPASDGSTRLALFSDFGTGLYHSRYIAKQLAAGGFPYAIHLGDVYYAGRQSEFDEHLIAPLQPLVDRGARLFLLNANHEMYSGAEPYFAYLDAKRTARPDTQEQVGSYFCLDSDAFRIVGIDTAYHAFGRHKESRLNLWLSNVLREGRANGSLNILLSQNAPFRYPSERLDPLLAEDLAPLATEGLIDLWFWGDLHYCALYGPSTRAPFIGSCIGHGGKPYELKKVGLPSPAPVVWLEAAARFPRQMRLRPDRGNNGYCVITLQGDGNVHLRYVDWMGNTRAQAQLVRSSAPPRLRIKQWQEEPIP